eukprot:CCRYP_021151-RA/>CCRYP_021151-RA protein AED:0.39 eAED:0.43 QI:0/0/0/1/0/0/3/0/255
MHEGTNILLLLLRPTFWAITQASSLFDIFAHKISLVLASGQPPEQWGVGLTVMLEKIARKVLVSQLGAILLMEADFNMHNRIEDDCQGPGRGPLPPKLFSTHNSTAVDGSLQKTILLDISCQGKLSCAITLNSASACYNRVVHSIVSLTFQAIGVGKPAIRSMLCPLQRMRFLHQTGFGKLCTYMGGLDDVVMQGVGQEKTASPVTWEVISSVMVFTHKAAGHRAHIKGPLSWTYSHHAGIIYVDDTDLITIGQN